MKVLITGAAGQDGRILSQLLTSRGHQVTGVVRSVNLHLLDQEYPERNLIAIDLEDPSNFIKNLNEIMPDAIVNLAGFSSVIESWGNPDKAIQVNSQLPALLLKWVSQNAQKTRFIQASSSEIFGGVKKAPQSTLTRLCPVTPYGASKAFAHLLVDQYRARYNLNASCAILYNHESVLRDPKYVTRHISIGVAKIGLGLERKLKIGNLQSRRDWGYAPDYVEGLSRLLDTESNGDFVFASGTSRSVQDLLKSAFAVIGIEDFHNYLEIDPSAERVIDPSFLVGDFSNTTEILGWKPTKTIDEVIVQMVRYDTDRLNGISVDPWDYL